MQRYDLCGLTVASDLALSARVSATPPPSPDLTVRVATSRVTPPIAEPDWVILARSDAGRGSVVGVSGDGCRVRYFGVCDFQIDRELSSVTAFPDPSTTDEFVGILVAGNLLAVVLTLKGLLPLHASAVAWAGSATAFVAASGMGKSTIATLLCIEGAELVTDDVLVVDIAAAPLCSLGHTELRLRPQNARLLDRTGRRRDTCDGRVAWQPDKLAEARPALQTIVIPRVDREASRTDVRRLSEREALLSLTQFPRVLGWQDAEIRKQQFKALAALVRAVPVFDAALPWSDDPSASIQAMMALLGADVA